MSYSSANHALAAKARAMYGKRLTFQNYKELLRKQTVNEIAAYLKQQSNYADCLSDINENLIHRGQLENIIKRQFYDEYKRMFHFIDRSERSFYNYNIIRMEVDEILNCLRFINAGRQGEYDFNPPAVLLRDSGINLHGLAKVRTFQDVLDLLKGSPYFDILKKHEVGEDNKIDTITIDTELRKFYYEKFYELIDRDLRGKTKESLKESVGMEIDLQNLMIILRLKKYFNASGEYIRSLLLPFHYRIGPDDIEKIISETDAASAWRAIIETKYGRLFKNYSFDIAEKYGEQVRYELHRKLLMFSNTAPVVVISYTQLKWSEINNLINIIEGIRYRLPPSEISKLLIGVQGRSGSEVI